MINLFCNSNETCAYRNEFGTLPRSNHDRSVHPLETVERDATYRAKSKPRHISALESKTHSSKDRLARAKNLSRPYFNSSKFNPSQAIDLAVNISRYQFRDRASLQKHSENVRSSLKHRLQMARERENARLIALLLAELKQLQTNT